MVRQNKVELQESSRDPISWSRRWSLSCILRRVWSLARVVVTSSIDLPIFAISTALHPCHLPFSSCNDDNDHEADRRKQWLSAHLLRAVVTPIQPSISTT
jgi:hypothetical protein